MLIMSEKIKKSADEDKKETHFLDEENIEATGQIILGEIEKIGGILTANQTAQAEGEYNIKAGKLHKKIAEDIAESESTED